MPDEFSVKMCTLVQMHPALYDICNEGFHNEEAKKNAWQEIAGELGVAQSKCVIKWKSLKHQYVKAKKEENTTWDLWPYLQFLDETAAAKSGPKKRKRESTATPMKMQAPATTDVDMPSADSAGMEHVEIKTAARSSRSTRGSRANPEKKETQAGVTRTARSRRASSVNDTVGEMDFIETGTPLQTVDTAPEPVIPEPSNKLSEPVQPTPTKGSARRQSARVSSVRFDVDATTAAHQANGTSSGTPLKAAAVITHDKTPAVQPAASAQEATVSEAVNRKWSPRKMAATSPAPSKAAAASPAPPKVTAASPAPPKARVSSTPRGRRSMRAAPAETISEEQEDDVQVEPPQPKRQRTEGNGVEANDQPDALADMKFETALDQKFFKQLKEKFDKLRPEVASTIKASIFRMLDEAADN